MLRQKTYLAWGTSMKLLRISFALVAFTSFAGLAYVAQQADSSGTSMVVAAQNFLDGLKEEQKTQATFSFESPERINWNFIPLQDMRH